MNHSNIISMIFRYKCGKIKEVNRRDFLTDKEYYLKIMEINTYNINHTSNKENIVNSIASKVTIKYFN